MFIATGATVFNGARIGKGAEVRVNAIVHIKTVVPAGATAAILPPDRHEQIWAIQKSLNFPEVVFGVGRPPEGETIMPDVMPRYAGALNRWHRDDEEVDG